VDRRAGTIAVGADAGSMVWSPQGTGGLLLHQPAGRLVDRLPPAIPAGAVVESDRVNPQDPSTRTPPARSTRARTAARRSPASSAAMPTTGRLHLRAVAPAPRGEVLVRRLRTGLLRSTDSGATFTKVLHGDPRASNVAFGKAAPGRSHRAVFLVGTVDGRHRRLPAPTTNATSWVRIQRRTPTSTATWATRWPATRNVFGPRLPGHQRPRHPVRRPQPPPPPTAPPPPRRRRPRATSSAVAVAVDLNPTTTATGPRPAARPRTGSPAQWSGGFQGEVTVTNGGHGVQELGRRLELPPPARSSRQALGAAPSTQTGAAVKVTKRVVQRHPLARRRHHHLRLPGELDRHHETRSRPPITLLGNQLSRSPTPTKGNPPRATTRETTAAPAPRALGPRPATAVLGVGVAPRRPAWPPRHAAAGCTVRVQGAEPPGPAGFTGDNPDHQLPVTR